jgi:hypothetical protein
LQHAHVISHEDFEKVINGVDRLAQELPSRESARNGLLLCADCHLSFDNAILILRPIQRGPAFETYVSSIDVRVDCGDELKIPDTDVCKKLIPHCLTYRNTFIHMCETQRHCRLSYYDLKTAPASEGTPKKMPIQSTRPQRQTRKK